MKNVKNKFCFEQNKPILRIPYTYNLDTAKDNIEQLVLDFINTRQVPQEILDFYAQYDFSNYVEIATKLNERS